MQLGGEDIRVSGVLRCDDGLGDWEMGLLPGQQQRQQHFSACCQVLKPYHSLPRPNPHHQPHAGSWDGWASQASLLPCAADGQQVRSRRGDAVRTLLVPRGVHDYKFIVDDKWRPAPADPVARDQAVGGCGGGLGCLGVLGGVGDDARQVGGGLAVQQQLPSANPPSPPPPINIDLRRVPPTTSAC